MVCGRLFVGAFPIDLPLLLVLWFGFAMLWFVLGCLLVLVLGCGFSVVLCV